ncbi:hypothetical protein MXAN_3617 [Myxococcus xanthus DK 1622]|uniref:Uncharacterized protein n=1 Tax=Myxococcus xanthus (strain DK1622) TaxID=246197 RepID=Q1D6B9_MYXXD|nr:hypothetical protein [Myxococcus xanthus]ABF87626.1 hypothetical protein MXAN_3617 [Myxococcus xanthus DK 1622]NOJ52231.1 hypothetical protein [Myxococcus xanthus]QZZ51309.1 hypothetical protein MyxoNM_19095 [Myxococcus xanthus]SDY36061.1 hypothetical protein SAMN05444383_1543 [Myxococcus xanthus]
MEFECPFASSRVRMSEPRVDHVRLGSMVALRDVTLDDVRIDTERKPGDGPPVRLAVVERRGQLARLGGEPCGCRRCARGGGPSDFPRPRRCAP